MTDHQLLRRYVQNRSQEAFAEVVRRHIDVVYSAARRQTRGDAAAAEDVTQRVFILLAQKAKSLDENVLLGGWLFNATRFAANDFLRKEQRRARHEQKAAEMAKQLRGEGRDDPWSAAETELDDAMARLGVQSRGLIVLRFFEGKTAREVGERLGISEEAARKRVSRAVDELRELFARRGVMMSVGGLAEALAINAVTHAPTGLAASAASAATSSAATAGAGAGLKGALTLMALKGNAAIAGVIGAVILGGAVIVGGVHVVRTIWFTPASRTITLAQPAGPKIKGVVRGPDGSPIAGAQVWVGTPRKHAYAYPGNRARPEAETDQTGNYVVTQPDATFVIMARSAAGYAELSWKQFQAGSDIKLQPWGRIEGILKQGGKPIPRGDVALWRVGENDDPVHHEMTIKADANGHFVFPQVAPGEACVYYRMPNFRSAKWQYVQVEPGKTSNVSIGGSGRSAVGRIDVPSELAGIIKWTNQGKYSYEASVRRDPDPTNAVHHAPDEAPEEYWPKELAFGKTPEGKLYKEWRFGSEFTINPDGSYVIDDLPPGKYKLDVRCFETDDEVNFMEDIAKVETRFEIPAGVAIADQTPIQIGSATSTVIPRVRPGAVAPDFTVTTIDGQTWRLADHRDKPVVLVFWGAYGHDERLVGFGEFAKKWGKDPRLTILGCFTADNIEEAKKYIAEYKLDFTNAKAEELMTKFDNSWPSAVIIGTDGKILQKHLEGKPLEKYVNRALGLPDPTTRPARLSQAR